MAATRFEVVMSRYMGASDNVRFVAPSLNEAVTLGKALAKGTRYTYDTCEKKAPHIDIYIDGVNVTNLLVPINGE